MTRMTGGRTLVEMLRRHGVDTIFALPGVQNDALFVAFYDAGEELRVIHTRHEQGSAYMAYGYARSSGNVGAYAVVPGPGLLNTTAALATAYATNTAVLCISGQIPSELIGRGFGPLHEIPDQLGILRTLTKWAARISHATETGQLVNEAFRQLRDGRPRPVALEMPLDVMALETEVALPAAGDSRSITMPDSELVDKAAALLADAKKPLIFVGGGAVAAAEEVLAIAEMLQAPVVSYTGGKGIVSDRHYLAQSALAGHELWREADVVLAVGTRLHQPQVRWGVDADLKLIRIDIDPTELTSMYPAAVPIQSDARAAMLALSSALASRKPTSQRSQGESRVREILARNAAQMTDLEKLHERVWKVLRSAVPADTIVMGDATQIVYTGSFAMPMEAERCWYYSGNYCALGFALPMAVGAKIGTPHRPVIAVAGDGGVMFTVNELATAAEERIALPVIVWNNDALKAIADGMDERRIPRIGVEPKSPDFMALADSLGGRGARAESAQHLAQCVREALVADRPTLIEVREDSPWLKG